MNRVKLCYLALSIARMYTSRGPILIYIPEVAIQLVQHDSHATGIHKGFCTALPTCFDNIPCSLDVCPEDGPFALHGIALRPQREHTHCVNDDGRSSFGKDAVQGRWVQNVATNIAYSVGKGGATERRRVNVYDGDGVSSGAQECGDDGGAQEATATRYQNACWLHYSAWKLSRMLLHRTWYVVVARRSRWRSTSRWTSGRAGYMIEAGRVRGSPRFPASHQTLVMPNVHYRCIANIHVWYIIINCTSCRAIFKRCESLQFVAGVTLPPNQLSYNVD